MDFHHLPNYEKGRHCDRLKGQIIPRQEIKLTKLKYNQYKM